MNGNDEHDDAARPQTPANAGAEGTRARLGDLYRSAAQCLRDAARAGSADGEGRPPEISTPDLDARLLTAEAVGLPPTEVHRASGQVVEPSAAERLAGLLARRIAGEPVHRIIGRRAFYEHEFALSAETLEPRPETEILVEVARPFVEAAIAARGECLFADVGTGSGVIAVSLLALYDRARAVAIDVSPGALATARRNAETAGVGERFLPVVCNHLSALGGAFDLVLSNPPYIPSGDIDGLALAVRRHDPMLALDGGPDGLNAYREISDGAARLLSPGAAVIVEIGLGQAADVEAIFAARGFAGLGRTNDLSGIERVLAMRSAPS
ncbi:peptide chain release factor N(5)-glutamine methyltransferase [Jiella pacifica]|uniref:peptide chain release factor N(5)-glutamine methyltransferase n=1 Tax=Jiella pacifica TaxID=2696469 RepID=A0A6N9T8W8_9HYPH|nr:peptide chain release factor N(5)-glutamine methyltransferase [Jiella pacifica]NDW07884.1 peptide chain release factor N(5)-glutamine methyltransferase [Jiella pacifica]